MGKRRAEINMKDVFGAIDFNGNYVTGCLVDKDGNMYIKQRGKLINVDQKSIIPLSKDVLIDRLQNNLDINVYNTADDINNFDSNPSFNEEPSIEHNFFTEAFKKCIVK